MAWGGLALSLFLAFVAVFILLKSRRWQREAGLPDGRVIYSDGGAWHPNEEVLYDMRLRLAGKPDFLVEQADGRIVPVEIKSGRAPELPYPGHVLQLIAYCRLVEATYSVRPAYGILQYSDRAFSVDYTPTLEQDLLDTLQDMRRDRQARSVDRDHGDQRRCQACGFLDACGQSLI
jgi:CRISPR-associated exonuclease Cas4